MKTEVTLGNACLRLLESDPCSLLGAGDLELAERYGDGLEEDGEEDLG